MAHSQRSITWDISDATGRGTDTLTLSEDGKTAVLSGSFQEKSRRVSSSVTFRKTK